MRRGNFCSDIWILLLERGQSTNKAKIVRIVAVACAFDREPKGRFPRCENNFVLLMRISCHLIVVGDSPPTVPVVWQYRLTYVRSPSQPPEAVSRHRRERRCSATLAAWVLWRTFQRIKLADVFAQMRAVPVGTLALAALCAAGAFTTLACYEIAVVRYVKHCIGRAKPMVTALIAFPLGSCDRPGHAERRGAALPHVHAGGVFGDGSRCDRAAGEPAVRARVRLVLDISLVVAAETLEPMFRISSTWLVTLGCIGLAKDCGYLLLVVHARKPVRLGGWHVNLPTPAMTALQLVVGIVDIGLVSSVLYLLLPESAGIALPAVPRRVPRERAGRRAEPRAGGAGRARVDAVAAAAGRAARTVARGGADVPRHLRNRAGARSRWRLWACSRDSRRTVRCVRMLRRTSSAPARRAAARPTVDSKE